MPTKKANRSSASTNGDDKDEILNAFHVLSLSVVDFYHCLKKARNQFHREELPDPKWNVISILEHLGPQTVPQMARSRKLSRQAIQTTVNLLHKDGYVDFVENPAHKKSALVYLTPKGSSLSDEMNRRERKLISKIELDISSGEMLKAAKVIQSLKTFFESRQWKELLKQSKA